MHTFATTAAFAPARTPFRSSSRQSNLAGNSRFSNTVQPQSTSSTDLLPRDISSRFGLRLRELRRSRNMTQLYMAIDFGIDRSFISDVERGRKSISLHMLEVIALGMKVSLADLFRGL